jgi:excisionase family DNA binding protein
MTSTVALTEGEAAAMLGLKVSTLRAWRHRHSGPRFVRFGRAVRYMTADLNAYIAASGVDTAVALMPPLEPPLQEDAQS